MKPISALSLVVLLLWPLSCGPNSSCVDLCTKLKKCGFIPSAMGIDAENCASRCTASPDIFEHVKECVGNNPAIWPESDTDESGCSTVASCIRTGDARAETGYGRVEMIPTACSEPPCLGPVSKATCSPAIEQDQAEAFCNAWGLSRARLFLHRADPPVEPKPHETSCAAALSSNQPSIKHVAVGWMSAALVLDRPFPEPTGAGGAGGNDPVAIGANPPQTTGSGGETSEPVPDRCYVFAGPVQVNRAGKCVGIEIPVAADLANARQCEAGAACSDGMDNDGDRWTDCDDPKCASVCATRRTEPPPTAAEGGAATE